MEYCYTGFISLIAVTPSARHLVVPIPSAQAHLNSFSHSDRDSVILSGDSAESAVRAKDLHLFGIRTQVVLTSRLQASPCGVQ